MSRARPRFIPEPRVWTRYQVACRLNKSEETLRKMLPELHKKGFPLWDELLGGFDADAIEAWLDRRAGLTDHPGNDIDGMIEQWGASG